MKPSLLPIAAVLFCSGCTPPPAAEITPAEELKTRLAACQKADLILFGHQDDLFYGHTWNRWTESIDRSDVRETAGDYPAVSGVELGGIELGDSLSIDGVPFELIRRGIADHHRRGGVTAVSWHPANPATGGDAWDTSKGDSVVGSILKGGANRAKFEEWMQRMGDFLTSLRDDQGEPIAVIWRPWHENAGNWFWWGAPYCSAEQYKALWHDTYDYLHNERGLRNLVWAVSPGFTDYCQNGYTDYYPGDEEVDLIGIDIYQYGTDEEFVELVRQNLKKISDFAAEHHKLYALTETGYEGVASANWWTQTLLPALGESQPAYVLVWRNAWDRPTHFYAPYPGQESAADFRVFTQQSRIGLLKAFNELK